MYNQQSQSTKTYSTVWNILVTWHTLWGWIGGHKPPRSEFPVSGKARRNLQDITPCRIRTQCTMSFSVTAKGVRGVYIRQSWNLAFKSAMCDSVGFIRPCHWTGDSDLGGVMSSHRESEYSRGQHDNINTGNYLENYSRGQQEIIDTSDYVVPVICVNLALFHGYIVTLVSVWHCCGWIIFIQCLEVLQNSQSGSPFVLVGLPFV